MRRALAALIGTICALLLPATALAASNPNPAIIRTCVVPGISCLGGDLSLYINATIVAGARYAFVGTLIAAIVYYGLRRLFMPDSESALNETRQSFEYAFVGAVLILGAELIASSFVTGGVADAAGVNSVFLTMVIFMKAIISVALLTNITIQGFRMIVASEDGETAKARKRFLHGCFGAAIVLVAAPIVSTLVGANHAIALTELKGIANYIITIFGFLAVVAIIVSGIWLVISVEDSMKERAKKLIIASVVALILVICAAALVNFFILA